MTGWPFPMFQIWKERVPKYVLHDMADWSWSRDRSFPLKSGAVPHVAVAENNLRVFELVYRLRKVPHNRASPLLDMSHVMACAAHYGHLEMLQWMVEMAAKEPEWWVWEENLMASPIRHRDFETTDFLYESLPRDSTRIEYSTLKKAVWNNDLELVQWVYDRDYVFSEQGNSRMKYLLDHAGSLEMLQLMHGHRVVGCSERVMEKAVKNRDFQMIKFLLENRNERWSNRAMDGIGGSGNLELVQFVRGHRTEGFSSEAMGWTAAGGHLQVVRLLHEDRNDGCEHWAMNSAAAGGHLDTVKFLHENRTEGCEKVAMDDATTNGHLEVVKFLHQHRNEGCTKNAMDNAAVNGHLEVVKFLHENRSEGCTVKALHTAVINDNFPMIRFLGKK